MSDLWGDAQAGSLLEACQARRLDVALNLLRFGPFLRRPRCAPPAAPGPGSWFAVRQMPPPEEGRASPLLGLLQTMVAGGPGLAVYARAEAGRPRLLLGVEGEARRATQVRSLLAPAVLLEPGGPPPPWPDGPVAGLVYRLTPTGVEREPELPARTTLSRLMTLPIREWAVLWTLRPVPTVTLDDLLSALEDCEAAIAPQQEHMRQRTPTITSTVADPHARRLAAWLDLLHSHVSIGRASGMWLVSCHATAAPDDMTMLVSALRAALADRADPGAAWVASSYQAGDAAAAPPRSLLTSRDVDRILEAPSASVPGIAVTPALPGGRVEVSAARPLRLGRRLGTDDPFVLDLDDLEGHGFVTGTTGCGKSTSVRRLLLDLWNDHGVPFLVIDPVKTDYALLAGEARGGLMVADARSLRLNVLRAWPGADPHVHLEQVANVFKGSFSMPPPVPYVVTHLFDQLQARVGVDPEPTLHDLRDRVDDLVRDLGYVGEPEAIIRAALGNRLGILVAPVRADRLASAGLDQLDHLLSRPAVVELQGLGDDEERAFLMSVLTLYVSEAARARGLTQGVRHVTVLEEAHRILPQPGRQGSDPDRGDAGGTSARLLTQLLAEIRAYGESLLIVDQSPGAVARDAIRNTNLKLAHRVLAPEDREEIAASMGMPEESSWGLARLAPGHALVSSRRAPEPQAVQVDAPMSAGPAGTVLTPPASAVSRACCAGQSGDAGHHLSERHGAEAARVMAVYAAGASSGDDGGKLASWVTGELRRLSRRRPGTRIACLAWVGLRRLLELDLQVGALGPRELAPHLAALFDAWRGQRPPSATPRRVRRPADWPFIGCTACSCRCSLRGAALARLAAEPVHGLPAVTARTTRDPIGASREWLAAEERALTPVLGKDAARSLALCALQHAMDAAHIDEHRITLILPAP